VVSVARCHLRAATAWRHGPRSRIPHRRAIRHRRGRPERCCACVAVGGPLRRHVRHRHRAHRRRRVLLGVTARAATGDHGRRHDHGGGGDLAHGALATIPDGRDRDRCVSESGRRCVHPQDDGAARQRDSALTHASRIQRSAADAHRPGVR
jgi:hypothetical protein